MARLRSLQMELRSVDYLPQADPIRLTVGTTSNVSTSSDPPANTGHESAIGNANNHDLNPANSTVVSQSLELPVHSTSRNRRLLVIYE
jgi:hypothetical protein